MNPDRPSPPADIVSLRNSATALPEIRVRHSGVLALKRVVDDRDGHLCIAEGERDIPFPIRRVYYITHLENCVSVRGAHAHKQLQQAIFCISGGFLLELDDGRERQQVRMAREDLGVLLGPGLWHTMHGFTTNCVLLVLASDYYDEADYIRDYGAFADHVAAGYWD